LTKRILKNGLEAIIKLVEIYAALTIKPSKIERGFSCIKRVKTDLRNKLSVGRLQDLMIISLNGEGLKLWRRNENSNQWNSINDFYSLNKS